MKLFFYLAKQYFKSFVIVAFGLTFAASLIDFVQYVGNIEGVNRKVLYFYYTFSDYFLFVYPIAFIFAAIIVFSNLVWKNHLLAFSSFGYEKSSVLKPFITVFVIVYFIIFILNFTQNKELKGVTLYIINNNKLSELLHFKSAKFKNKMWIATNVEKKVLKYKNNKPIGYKILHVKKESILKGYYPKVVRLLYEGERMSIYDGFKALTLLSKQKIDSSKVKSALYTKVLMPATT